MPTHSPYRSAPRSQKFCRRGASMRFLLAFEMPMKPNQSTFVNQLIASTAVMLGAAVVAASAFAATSVNAIRVIEWGADGPHRPSVITGVALSEDGVTIAAACDDHTVRIWDAPTGDLRSELVGHRDWVRSVALSPDGQTLASGSNDHTICLWNTATGERISQSSEFDHAVAALSFHPNGQQLAVVGNDDCLAIVNTSTGQLTQQLDCPSADLRAVAFSPSGERMAVAGRNGTIRLWNIITGTMERDITTSCRRIRALSFSPDGTRLASAGDGVMIHVLDLQGGGQDITLPARPAKIYAAVFLNDQTLAVGGSDNRIQVWDLVSRSVAKELVGHTGSVATLACDRSGTLLVSGSYDTTLRVWNLNETAMPASVAQTPSDTQSPHAATR